jgi:para-nitrobenzyl esterase
MSLGAEWTPLPNVDGYVLPDEPVHLFATGQHPNHVPFLIGSNAQEFGFRGLSGPRVTDPGAYQMRVAELFGAVSAPQILAKYPVSDYASPNDAFVALWSDEHFTCPARRYARALSTGQNEGVYRYFFTHAIPGDPLGQGAVHASELRFLFHNFASVIPTPAEEALSQDIESYWSGLAAHGDPSGSGAPLWPRYATDDDPYLQLDTPPRSQSGVRTALCDFWDNLSL